MSRLTGRELCLILDTSSLIALGELGILEYLMRLKEMGVSIIIPKAVKEELTPAHERIGDLGSTNALRLSLPHDYPEVLLRLGPGERDVILAALSLRESGKYEVRVVIDDRRAQKICERLNIDFTGTAGLIVFMKAVGLIEREEAHSLLDSLLETSLFITEDIIEQAKEEDC
ncbi:MAG: hypothetical protein J7L91_04675 [Candidatus Korarchaeota archaeon]|nr:hypothetical protein [Candidatus Korarchaeota archaeon]